MKKKIDWVQKAGEWLAKNPITPSVILKVARGMKYEHMFKRLIDRLMSSGEPPDGDWIEHECECKTVEACWRRFRKELEK